MIHSVDVAIPATAPDANRAAHDHVPAEDETQCRLAQDLKADAQTVMCARSAQSDGV